MKHPYIHLAAAALAFVTLTGCANAEQEPTNGGRKACPEFSATIEGVHTRAFDSSWEPGDRIGVTGSYRFNVCYVTTRGDGLFSVETPGNQIYFQDEGEMIFTAFYPWVNLAEDESVITANTESQAVAAQKGFDFLWAQAMGKKDAPNVTFNFSHRMAKVVLTLKAGEDMSYEEVKNATLSLGGFNHTGTFSVSTGTVGVNGTAVDKWVFTGGVAPAVTDDASQTVKYSLLLFPQAFASPLPFEAELSLPDPLTYHLRADLDFTSSNRERDGENAKNEWVAGRQYNLTLTLHKTYIQLDRSAITSWEDVAGGDITVD